MNSSGFDWGITLSGGGARGIIHIGVLQALEDEGLKPVCVSGTSMGAIVGAFYAAGMKPNRMLELIAGKGFLNMFRIKPSFSGLLEMRFLKKMLKDELPRKFEDLEIPLFVAATNLNTHQVRIFSEGPLQEAVLASASIPLLFAPVEIDGEFYVDGGVIENLPSEPCLSLASHVLGVEVNKGAFSQDLNNMKDIAIEVFQITVENNTKPGIDRCSHVIQPQLDKKFTLLDFSKSEELYELGLEEGRKWIKANKMKELA
jgi:NTE family protein